MESSKYTKNIKHIIVGIIGLTFIIIVHEFGHFTFAKLFNVRTPIFSVGFDPAVFSRQIGSTKFQIGAIPLGGYVSINTKDLEKLPYLKEVLIMLAGILFNILLSLSILFYLYTKSKHYKNNDSLDLDNQEHNLSGVKYFLYKATPKEVRKILKEQKDKSFIGPLGIMNLIGSSFDISFDAFLYFISLVSFNIAFFNLLPVPFFDGGQIFTLTLQKLFGLSISENISNLIYYIFLVILIIFTVLLFRKDFQRIRKKF